MPYRNHQNLQHVSSISRYNFVLAIQIMLQILYINSMDVITIGLKFEDIVMNSSRSFEAWKTFHPNFSNQELFLEIFCVKIVKSI